MYKPELLTRKLTIELENELLQPINIQENCIFEITFFDYDIEIKDLRPMY